MPKRRLRPEDEAAITDHFAARKAEVDADATVYSAGDLVTFKPGDREKPSQPGIVTKVTPSCYGTVFWVDLGGGTTVRTLAGRLKRRKAFTLIDVLVVIAIVAVLIAILSPSLGKSRESARLTKCSSNLTQIRFAMIAYVDTYQAAMIWNDYPEDEERWKVEPTQAVWVCPSDPDKGVNRRGGLTSYDASGFRNAMYFATKPKQAAGVHQADTTPHLLALAWDYQQVHFKKRNRVFATDRPRLIP